MNLQIYGIPKKLNSRKLRKKTKTRKTRKKTKTQFKQPNPDNYLFMVFGPTGSGKSNLAKHIAELYNKDIKSFAKIIIDDLVENDTYYKKEINTIIENLNCTDNPNCLNAAFNSPTLELYKSFNDAYWNTRKNNGCGKNDSQPLSCDAQNDQVMIDAFTQKKDVLFEGTGENSVGWMLKPEWTPPDYKIIISYTLIPIKQIIKRNKNRAYDAVKKYLENPTQYPAPRLPNMDPTIISEKMNKVNENLYFLFDKCLSENSENNCGKRKIDRLLVFTNETSLKPIYDSDDLLYKNITLDEFKNIVNRTSKTFYSPSPLGSKIKSPIKLSIKSPIQSPIKLSIKSPIQSQIQSPI